MRIAALQTDIVWEDSAANFERLVPWLRTAAAAGARLVALPEMYGCGFTMNTKAVKERFDGPSAVFLRDQAAEHGLWLAGSMPELAEDADGRTKPFNTLVLAGPGGEMHRYRKLRPFSHAGEDRHYSAGSETVTVEIPADDELLRLTLFVCYDLRFADLFWDVAEETDAYLVVANWPVARRRHWIRLLEARAIENQAYVIGVNRVGSDADHEYAGDSRIIDPMGEVLASAAGGETMLLAEVDPSRVHRARTELPFLSDRRPE